MITMRDFAPAMGFLCEMLPMQRALSDEALAMAWETMPNGAKLHLTQESLAFAVRQRLVDPAPPKEQALHIALLRYVFPVERTIRRERGEEVIGDRVLLENGPRADLPERMAHGDRFHDPAPVRHEQAPPPPERPRLPGGGRAWHPSELSPEQLRSHVQRIETAMQRLRVKGPGDRAWRPEQLAQGKWWFEKALQGFWPLQVDDGGLGAAWILSNPREADALLGRALAGNLPALPPAEGLPVTAILGGFGGGGREAAPW
jgi:hypothetical protein